MRLYCYVDSLQIFVNPNVLWICKNYCTRIYRCIYVMYSNLHLSLSYISWKMGKPQIYMEMYAVSFLSFSFYILQMFIFLVWLIPIMSSSTEMRKKLLFFNLFLIRCLALDNAICLCTSCFHRIIQFFV